MSSPSSDENRSDGSRADGTRPDGGQPAGSASATPAGTAADGTWGREGELAGVRKLLRAVVEKQLQLLIQYPVNTLAGFVGSYVFFAVLFLGGEAVAEGVGGGTAVTSTFEGLVVGWYLWTMSAAAYFSLAGNVTRESEWGTLEQLYMSPYGFGTVMAVKVLWNLIWSVGIGTVLLVLMLVTTGRTIAIDAVTVLPIVVLALLSVVGLGFVFAGLALVYKRIENVSQLMNFVILGLVGAPVTGSPLVGLLPLAQGSAMLQQAMRDGVGLWAFPAVDLAMLVGTAVVYATAGYLVFRYCTGVARRRGVMGHY